MAVFRAVKRATEAMEARVMRKVKAASTRKGTRHWDYGDDYDPGLQKKVIDAKKVMDLESEQEAFLGSVLPPVENVYAKFGEAVTSTFGATWNLRDPAVAADILQRSNRLAGTVETTWHAVQEALIDGEAAGESIDGIAKRVGRVFEQAKGYRARVIARTETVGAANAGALQGATQTGVVEKKVWLATVDHRTRSSHVAADGQAVELAKKFAVGASRMDHPGDPAGGASEVVQCRCTMLFQRAPEEDGPEVVGFDGEDVSPLVPKGEKPSTQVAKTMVTKGGKAVSANAKTPKAIDRAKAAIDKVHGTPELTNRPDGLPLVQSTGTRTLGQYSYYADGRPVRISVSSGGDHPGMTFVHEFGHFFDHRDFGSLGRYTSHGATAEDAAKVEAWKNAVSESQAIKDLRAMRKAPTDWKQAMTLPDGREVTFTPDRKYTTYLLSDHEVFARSYAQWIARESGDEMLLAELAADQGKGAYWGQWEDDDFGPIAEAFRALFKGEDLVE